MNDPRFQQIVSSAEELAELLGTPGTLAVKKQRSELDRHMCSFITESPFLLLGTVGRDGSCDVSPRGDAPGLVKVLDPHTLLIPERPGNRRADSLRNILETGRAGLLFLIPGVGETLRVNGRAYVVRDEAELAALAVGAKRPVVGIVVEVEECFLHCARALLRSRLWEGHVENRTPLRPCFAEVLIEQTGIQDLTVDALQGLIDEAYTKELY